MSGKDSLSKYGKKAVIRQTDDSTSKKTSKSLSHSTSTRSSATSRTDRLRGKKIEIFQTGIKNVGQLKNNLEKKFTWCREFSDDDSLSKDEKVSLFEVTILVNQTIGHMKILQDALDECKESSPSWEDLFETIADHFQEYLQAYIQNISSLEDMIETIQSLKSNESISTRLSDISWLGKKKCDFHAILTYPRDQISMLKYFLDESKAILNEVDGKTLNESDRAELYSCDLALSQIHQILAADSSSKPEKSKPSGNNVRCGGERLPKCKVQFSFRPGKDDELRLKENDIIEIIKKDSNGWWKGRLNNKVGWFPGNYVTELEDTDSDSGSTDSTEKADSSDEEINARRQQTSHKDDNEDSLSRLHKRLSSVEEERAIAEARVQELIIEAQKAKAEAEARAEKLKQALKAPKVEPRRQSNSSESDSSGKQEESDEESSDNSEEEVDGEEYDVDQAEVKNTIKELDEMASLAVGNDPRQKTKKKVADDDDVEYDDLECYFCKKVIQTYVPKDGKSYCPSCYEDIFVKKCYKCKKPITGAGLTYKEKPWHSSCFTCSQCDAPLAGEKFISREDKPYCADCFGEHFAKRCASCTKPIIGDNGMSFITSGGRSWHNECFACTTCKDSLIGRGFFFSSEDKIVCPGCG